MADLQVENADNQAGSVTYKLNGKTVTRRKTGFSKENLATEKYAKVRQNSSEFGHCSKLGKAIRLEVSDYISDCGDRLIYQKFAQLMTQIKDLDIISQPGKRTVKNGLQTESAKDLLKNFHFGEIPNLENCAEIGAGFFTLPVIFKHHGANKSELVALKLNFENCSPEKSVQKAKLNSKTTSVDFDLPFGDEEPHNVLYFLAVYKDDKLLNFGFLV